MCLAQVLLPLVLSNNSTEELNVSIFPNPTSEKLYINFNDNNSTADRLMIVDLLGNTVLENGLNIRNEIHVGDLAKEYIYCSFTVVIPTFQIEE
ncbi:MAG: T9SS type A sorting domain-containing protein [Bacteroidetes bacterium]|nr:T9SS type A sorting domain-containing protein [Bacteroidota bacterium]